MGYSMEKKIRGTVLNGYLKYIQEKWGEGTLRVAKAELGIDMLDFKDGVYYQDEIVGNILRWIHRNKGQDAVIGAGRYILHNLGILSWMVRFSDVKTIAKKFPKNFGEVYTFGSCSVDLSDPKKIWLILKDVCYYEEACLVWRGICEEALNITKTKGRVSHPRCQLDGYENSAFLVEID